MKNREPVTLEYHELFRYQEITEAAILLVSKWETIDRSAQDWFVLQQLIEALASTIDDA